MLHHLIANEFDYHPWLLDYDPSGLHNHSTTPYISCSGRSKNYIGRIDPSHKTKLKKCQGSKETQ